jgi:hypothetical protein
VKRRRQSSQVRRLRGPRAIWVAVYVVGQERGVPRVEWMATVKSPSARDIREISYRGGRFLKYVKESEIDRRKPKKRAAPSSPHPSPTAVVPKYRDELARPLTRRLAKNLCVGDVLYPRGAVVQAVEAYKERDRDEWDRQVDMVRVFVRYKGAGIETLDTFAQEVRAEFEYLLQESRSW